MSQRPALDLRLLARWWDREPENYLAVAGVLSAAGMRDGDVQAHVRKLMAHHGVQESTTDLRHVLVEHDLAHGRWPGSEAVRAGLVKVAVPKIRRRAAPTAATVEKTREDRELIDAVVRRPLNADAINAALLRQQAEEASTERPEPVERWGDGGYCRPADVRECKRLWGILCGWRGPLAVLQTFREDLGAGLYAREAHPVATSAAVASVLERLARLQRCSPDGREPVDEAQLALWAEKRRLARIAEAEAKEAAAVQTGRARVAKHRNSTKHTVRGWLDYRCARCGAIEDEERPAMRLELHKRDGGGAALRRSPRGGRDAFGEWRYALKLGRAACRQEFELLCRVVVKGEKARGCHVETYRRGGMHREGSPRLTAGAR